MLLFATLLLLLQDSTAQGYLSRLCHKLSPATEIRLVIDTDVRAAAIPGDRVELSSGLFARVQNEAQLAGVIAHQIAHGAAKTACIRFIHIPFGELTDLRAASAEDVTQRHLGHTDAEYQGDREHERAADEAAIRTLTKAGYNPTAMLNFFSKYRREGSDLSHAFSAEDLLIEKLQIEATDHPLKDAIVDTPEFDRIHALVR